MHIKILGGGCRNCEILYNNTSDAVNALGLNATIEKVTDMNEIMTYGISATPALVIDELVASFGKVLKVEEITSILNP